MLCFQESSVCKPTHTVCAGAAEAGHLLSRRPLLPYFSTNAHKVLPGVDDVGVQSDALSVLLPDISCRIVILPMRGGTPTAVDRFTIEIQTV